MGHVVLSSLFVLTQTLATIAAVCIGCAFGNRAAWRAALVIAVNGAPSISDLAVGYHGLPDGHGRGHRNSGHCNCGAGYACRFPQDVLRTRSEDFQLPTVRMPISYPRHSCCYAACWGCNWSNPHSRRPCCNGMTSLTPRRGRCSMDARQRVLYHSINVPGLLPLRRRASLLWFMLPFQNDSFASLAGFYWLLLGAVSIFGIRPGFSRAGTPRRR